MDPDLDHWTTDYMYGTVSDICQITSYFWAEMNYSLALKKLQNSKYHT
jgi:hypothetical protein